MKDQRFLIAGEAITAKQALYPPDFASNPSSWLCPYCKDRLAQKRPIGDVIQYGFEWDKHTTIMQCVQCGKHMFGTYSIWLTTPEKRERNA